MIIIEKLKKTWSEPNLNIIFAVVQTGMTYGNIDETKEAIAELIIQSEKEPNYQFRKNMLTFIDANKTQNEVVLNLNPSC